MIVLKYRGILSLDCISNKFLFLVCSLRVSCKVNVKSFGLHLLCKPLDPKYSWEGFTLTLQETQGIHDSMKIPKIELISKMNPQQHEHGKLHSKQLHFVFRKTMH